LCSLRCRRASRFAVLGNDAVQAGQILGAQASITGDATDEAASVTYHWQFSSNGGQTWSAPVASTTTGLINGELSGLYQLTQAETGDLVRAVATFTDDTGQQQTATGHADHGGGRDHPRSHRAVQLCHRPASRSRRP